jgi:hypothetical protein
LCCAPLGMMQFNCGMLCGFTFVLLDGVAIFAVIFNANFQNLRILAADAFIGCSIDFHQWLNGPLGSMFCSFAGFSIVALLCSSPVFKRVMVKLRVKIDGQRITFVHL